MSTAFVATDHQFPTGNSNNTIYKRSRTQPSYVPTQVQDTVEINNLSKYVLRDSNLLTELGWEQVVRSRRQRGDFGHLRIPHPAQRFLRYLRARGVPVVLTTKPWDDERVHAAALRGPHKSARDHRAFLHTEMADMINKNQWIVLPYSQARELPNLRISPIGVVPQRDRRPRTIVDYSFSGVNQDTCPIAPNEAMQFGTALQRVIESIVNANPRFGPMYLCKVDISDGFYRVGLRPADIPKMGVVLPSLDSNQDPLIAFPLVLPMGWKNSPPFFCALTETVADVTNERIRRHQWPKRHRMDRLADSIQDDGNNRQTVEMKTDRTMLTAVPLPPMSTSARPAASYYQQPVQKFDIYVDDFLGMAQGTARTRNRIRRTLFNTLDQVLRPKDAEDDEARQEPISVKKLRKGDARWSTTKPMLGWIIDTIQSTITLPPHRLERLHTILRSIPAGQRRVSVRKWQQMLGELRAMAIAIPGARGIFSHLQAALQARNVSQGRIRVSSHVRATLDDFTWLADSLQLRPTRMQELVAQPPHLYGTSDASGRGMGGTIIPPTTPTAEEASSPVVWRFQFPPDVQRKLVSADNPHGTITNSDLELAATIIQHDAMCNTYDVREHTIHTSTDNQATQAWQRHGSATTNAVPAFLLRLQAIHQRFHRYVPMHSYLPGKLNAMADDASRLWNLSDNELLTHFNVTYPQHRSWHLYHPRPEMLSAVICALHRTRSQPASFLAEPKQPTTIGSPGYVSANPSKWIRTSKTSTIRLPCFKSTYSDTASEPSRPVASLSDLERWRTRYEPLARRSRHWGPRTRAATNMDTSTSGFNGNCAATHVPTHRLTE